ncbi:MAG: FixH family protein [Balneolaceae bacterium]
MKSIKHTFYSAILWTLLLAFIAAGCSDSTNSGTDELQEPDLLKLGEFTDNEYTVSVYSNEPLMVGYNDIYVEVHQDGDRMDHAHIHFNPMMQMENHSHASPYGVPGQNRDDEHNLYKAWAIFTMPSGMMGSWELQFTIHDADHNGLEINGIVEIDVENSNRVKTFLAPDETSYVITWIEPTEPEVGMNDLVVSLHKRESMMSFPPVTSALMNFEPWMPSMGHGSSNNVDPVHEENGFYHGSVNFNMTGDWELRFNVEMDGEELASPVFELEF